MLGRLKAILPRALHVLSPPLIFAGATLAFYWEMVLPAMILADYDAWVYFYPLRTYAAEAVRAGRFPLWNPDTFLGAPFFANPQTAMLYPGTALFYLLPVPYAFSLSVIGHVFLAAVFMHLFLRRAVGIQLVPAMVGASAFAFGGFLSSQVGHINQLSASAWLPAIALCADQAARLRSPRWAAAGALALGIQLLAGHAQESFMSLWVVGLLLAWRAIDAGSGTDDTNYSGAGHSLGARFRRIAARVSSATLAGAAIVGLGFGLAAVQLLPAAELGTHSVRAGGMSYAEATSFSMRPTEFFRSIFPGYWYNPTGENIGYVGGIGLALAAFGLTFGRPGPIAFATACAALGLFLALGGANPFYRQLLETVPGLGLFRVPARWLFVYSFGVATLAGLGLDWAWTRMRSLREGGSASLGSGPGRLLLMVCALGSLLWLGSVVPPNVPGRIAVLWIGALLVGFVLLIALSWGPRRLLGPLILIALLVELRAAAMDLPQRHVVPAAATETARPVPAYLTSHLTSGRILSVAAVEYEIDDHAQLAARYPQLSPEASFELKSALKLDEVMSPNVPLKYHLSTVDGYDGGVLPLRSYLTIGQLMVPAADLRPDGVVRTRIIALPSEQVLRLFDVRAVIAGKVADVELVGLRFDVATARTLRNGQSITIPLSEPVDAASIGLLGSVASVSPLPSGGRMILERVDGSGEDVALRVGEHVYLETVPGPASAPQPTAGLSRGGRRDSAVRIDIPEGEPVRTIEWQWEGPNPLDLRAATIVSATGQQHQILLQPGLERIEFANLKVYRLRDPGRGTRLVPTVQVSDDEETIERIRSGDPSWQDRVVFLAPLEQARSTSRPDSGQARDLQGPGAIFSRVPSSPERLVYERVDGDGGGFLVVNDAWFPGWRAEVDGTTTPVLRANVHFKAVEVPAGARRVVLTYEPASLQLGAIASLTSAFVIVGALLASAAWGRLRKRGA